MLLWHSKTIRNESRTSHSIDFANFWSGSCHIHTWHILNPINTFFLSLYLLSNHKISISRVHKSQHELKRRRLLSSLCQHLNTSLSDQEGMFKLSRSLPVSCDGSPVIWPSDILMHPGVDHRLYREDVSRFHETCRFVVGVVRNIWGTVE